MPIASNNEKRERERGRGGEGETMIGENQQLVTNEPVEFEM
jgi:hypothetical protein